MSIGLSLPISRIQDALSLRANVSFWEYLNNRLPVILSSLRFPYVRFRDLILSIRNGKDVSRSGYATEETDFVYLTVNNIKKEGLSFDKIIYLKDEKGSDLSPKRLEEGDFIITRSGSVGVAHRFMPPDKKIYIPSGYLVVLRIDETKIDPAFLELYLKSRLALEFFQIHSSGKSQKNLSQTDIRRFFVPLGSLPKTLYRKITGFASYIRALEMKIEEPVEIINRIFAREFGYSLEKYEKRAKQNRYQKAFTDLDKAFLLRTSIKFLHPKYDYLDEILSRHPWIKLKTLCAERIHRGVQPKYDTDGEVLVVKTLNLKHEYLDFSEQERVTQKFFEANRGAEIKKNDLLISSTGEGRGKVDIYDLEESAIADTHISIVRLKETANPYYVLYFMRSLLGKLQLETLEMAIKGTPEIYWHQLEQMRIIDLPRKKQNLIVEEVRAELQELQRQRADIQRLRDKIDEIFMKAITQ